VAQHMTDTTRRRDGKKLAQKEYFFETNQSAFRVDACGVAIGCPEGDE
jgi:hypothetical protein